MSIRNALEELLLIVEIHQKCAKNNFAWAEIVEIHQKCTKNNFAWAEVEHAKELLAQPEQESPTHEPLSDDEIWVGMGDEPPISCSGFVRGVKFAEKHHGIRGEE